MPEHVHLLIGEPDATPSDVMRELKQAVAFALFPVAVESKRQRKFWQPRFCDFNVWSVRKKNEKLHYNAHESGEAWPRS